MKRLFRVVTMLAGVAGVWACGGQIDGGGGDGGPGGKDADQNPNVDGSIPGECAVPVPAPIQPLAARHGISEICAGGGGPPAPSDTVAAVQATVVGRWIACDGGDPRTTGLELDGNGRYRYLVVHPDQTVAPASPERAGCYNFYGEPQMIMHGDGASWGAMSQVTFPTGTDSMRLQGSPDGTVLYARIAPSPTNGSDNPPPLTNGACTMAGTWDVQSPAGSGVIGTFKLDALGNFIGGAGGADVCASPVFHGKYQLSPGLFEITESEGMGCPYEAFWTPRFDASCAQVTLTGISDDCTGARSFIQYDAVMIRRP